MSHNEIFDFTGFTAFDLNNFDCDNFKPADDLFSVFNRENKTCPDLQNHQYACSSKLDDSWYLQPPEVGGKSQPYMGLEVLADPSGPSHLDDPVSAPTTLYPGNQLSRKSCFHPQKYRPETHSFVTGYNSPFHPGVVIPTSSPQPVTIRPSTAISASHVPALSRGRKSHFFFIKHRSLTRHNQADPSAPPTPRP